MVASLIFHIFFSSLILFHFSINVGPKIWTSPTKKIRTKNQKNNFYEEKNNAMHGTRSTSYGCLWIYYDDQNFMNYTVMQRNDTCLCVNKKSCKIIVGYSKKTNFTKAWRFYGILNAFHMNSTLDAQMHAFIKFNTIQWNHST